MTQSTNNLAAYYWSITDLLRGNLKQRKYCRIISPFTLLRRLEGVLNESKEAVLAEYKKLLKQQYFNHIMLKVKITKKLCLMKHY